MIPKIIHYCWFGNKRKPRLVKKCIKSWKKYAPDFRIVEWNEKNFDISSIKYCQEAYVSKKWAFVSDVARIYALDKFGGIYLDTDYELKKEIDSFCLLDFFTGFENDSQIGFGIFGASKSNPIISKWLGFYKKRKFVNNNGLMDLKPIGLFFMEKFDYKKLQNGKTIFFGREYFYPRETESFIFGLHHYQASWHTKKEKFITFLGPQLTSFLVKIKRIFRKK
mgnify:CR=1 FL=1